MSSSPRGNQTTAVPSPLVPFESLWDAKDVAAYLKCSLSKVYKDAENGTLPCRRYGALLRFHPDAIRAAGTPVN